MLPFEYETIERPDEAVCIYHNVTMLKALESIDKGEYFTKVKYNVDKKLIEFFFFDNIVHVFHIEINFMELEMV